MTHAVIPEEAISSKQAKSRNSNMTDEMLRKNLTATPSRRPLQKLIDESSFEKSVLDQSVKSGTGQSRVPKKRESLAPQVFKAIKRYKFKHN